ncbi:MAG: SDR family oxidoreductase [Planctomycetota bacterium]
MSASNRTGRPCRRHALVMGGGRGIGAAIARRLAADGYALTISDHLGELAKALAGELEASGFAAWGEQCDITSAADLKRLAGVVRKRTGSNGLDAAVSSVGVFDERGPLLRTSLASFERVMNVNVTGALLFSQEVVPLLAPGASLIFLGSINGMKAGADLGAYKVSKAALHMLARCLALELAPAPRSVRVNVVAPGWVDTPGERAALRRHRGRVHPLDDPETAKWLPLGRRVDAGEIAGLVSFLCSASGSSITGQVIPIDSGIMAS